MEAHFRPSGPSEYASSGTFSLRFFRSCAPAAPVSPRAWGGGELGSALRPHLFEAWQRAGVTWRHKEQRSCTLRAGLQRAVSLSSKASSAMLVHIRACQAGALQQSSASPPAISCKVWCSWRGNGSMPLACAWHNISQELLCDPFALLWSPNLWKDAQVQAKRQLEGPRCSKGSAKYTLCRCRYFKSLKHADNTAMEPRSRGTAPLKGSTCSL